jgi:apolipoprotein N-acyltransferase
MSMLRLSPLLAFILAILAGALTARGFAPTDWWLMAVLGSAALVALIDVSGSRAQAAAIGWGWGFGMFATSLGWIATAFTFQSNMPAAMGWVAVIGLSAFLALYPMLAALVARWVPVAGLPRLLMLAGAFMLTEWLRGVLLSGFAWNPLGAAWLEAPGVAQMAQFVGAQGLSALMLMVGGGLWLLLRPGASLPGRAIGAGLWLFAGLCGVFGLGRLDQEFYFPDNPTLVIVQPNIGQDEKYDPGANERHLETYLTMSRESLGMAEPVVSQGRVAEDGAAEPFTGVDPLAGANEPQQAVADRTFSDTLADVPLAARPNILIWSESAVFGLPEEDPALRARLASVLGPRDLLVFGGVAARRDARGEILTLANSLFVLDYQGRLRARYDKSHLTPLGEYLPAQPLMEKIGLARLAPGSYDFTPGPGPRTLNVPGLPSMGAMICYEIIFGSRVTEYGKRPAWIANISNDAWFGASGPPQHLAQARLRAIEEALPIARATPTGVSAVIGPRGRLLAQQPFGTSGVLRYTLPPPLPATVYARYGDALPLGLAAVLALAGLWRGRRPTPVRPAGKSRSVI